jgi:hypothetical protein
VTVADELAFDELPEEIKELVRRVYGPKPESPTVSAREAEAYMLGWNDCVESFEAPYEVSDDEAARKLARAREWRARRADFLAQKRTATATADGVAQ